MIGRRENFAEQGAGMLILTGANACRPALRRSARWNASERVSRSALNPELCLRRFTSIIDINGNSNAVGSLGAARAMTRTTRKLPATSPPVATTPAQNVGGTLDRQVANLRLAQNRHRNNNLSGHQHLQGWYGGERRHTDGEWPSASGLGDVVVNSKI